MFAHIYGLVLDESIEGTGNEVDLIVTTIRMRAAPEGHKELFQTLDSLYKPISKERGCLGCHFYSEIGNDAMI